MSREVAPQLSPTEFAAFTRAAKPRAGRLCVGSDCETLVLQGRICSACLDGAAIELVRGFERQLIADGYAPGGAELRAALAGGAAVLPVSWFQRHSGFGFDLTVSEAAMLRVQTDAACLLVALGGVAALRHLTDAGSVRGAIDNWTREEEAAEDADPRPLLELDDHPLPGESKCGVEFGREGRKLCCTLKKDHAPRRNRWGHWNPCIDELRSPQSHYGRTLPRMDAGTEAVRMDELYRSMPDRIDAGMFDLSKIENRFDAYSFAVLSIMLFLLFHLA